MQSLHGATGSRIRASFACGARTARSAGAPARRRRRRDGAGKVVRISGVTMDITERKEAEERQALLAREVDHRAKNAMAIVQSIVRLTKAGSIASYVSIIEGRIKALSRAHALLSNSRWQGADLDKLVDEELAPYRSTHAERLEHFRAQGPARADQGADARAGAARACHQCREVRRAVLRVRKARAVEWELQADALTIHWQETAGPETHTPAVTGFGTQDHHRQHRAAARRRRRSSSGWRRDCAARSRCRAAKGASATTRRKAEAARQRVGPLRSRRGGS